VGGTFHFSHEIINAAADRWEKTKPERDKRARAKAEGRHDEIDSKDRIVKHANRLRQQLRAPLENIAALEKAAVPAPVRELAARKPVARADINSLFVERVIGPTKDFLSAEFFELGSYAMRSVARIRTEFGGSLGFGTGFMVSPSLLLTNEHVLENAGWAAASVAEFDYQRDRLGRQKLVQSFHLDPERFFVNDKALDFALVAVKPAPGVGTAKLADFGFCPLVGVEGKILVTDPVNIVQHPQGRMKEVVIRENELSALPLGDLDGFAHYLGDTEPGSSGSPVFNDRWEVVALHHSSVPERDAAGNYLTRDGKIWKDTMPIEDIAWIGNEGIRISRIINHLKQREGLSAGAAALLKELLEKSDTTEIGPRQEEGVVLDGGPEKTCALDLSGTATVTVPVTIRVEVGGARAVRAELGQAALLAERVRPAPDYGGRPGFDSDFLGAAVPMPDLVDRRHGEPAMLADGSVELKYHHFSVLMNADRRLAYVSAVNYDAAAPFVEERGADDWFLDPRIDVGLQADNRFYKNNPLDRGHLARRYDAGWGMTAEEAKIANDDTFHWTNCAPQHQVFNQSKLSQPGDLRLWGELENHITDQAKQDMQRLSIFNGPVFGKDDRTHRGLLIPSAYWKMVAYRSRGDELRAVGFVLHQADLISNLAAERFDVGRFDLRQVRISRIEELTGLDFKGLRNVDPMAATGVREVFEGAVVTERKLKSAADIRF
jgi:endonuclease G